MDPEREAGLEPGRDAALALDVAATHFYRSRAYHLQDVGEYTDTLREAGFEIVSAEDVTSDLIDSLEQEREDLIRHRAEFLLDFDEADYRYLVERWEMKTRFCRQGDLRWGLFVARKPSNARARTGHPVAAKEDRP